MVDKCPEDVLAKGRKELRLLIDKGSFARYKYMDLKSGKTKNKTKLVLHSAENSAKREAYFIVPLKQKGKFFMIEDKGSKIVKVWDGKKAVEV